MNNGKMDGFDLISHDRSFACTLSQDYLWYTQFTQQDIPNYWAYAQNLRVVIRTSRRSTPRAFPPIFTQWRLNPAVL